jgi:hypothetical protein
MMFHTKLLRISAESRARRFGVAWQEPLPSALTEWCMVVSCRVAEVFPRIVTAGLFCVLRIFFQACNAETSIGYFRFYQAKT